MKRCFFAGDRAADLLEIKTSEILRFPHNSGFLFNHVWTKSLRPRGAYVFAFSRGSNLNVCPVWGLELYVNVCNLLRIRLTPGFLFRPVTKSNGVGSSCLKLPAVQARLNFYASLLAQRLTRCHFTLHGFRSGDAVSLALEGVSLHEIMDHVGWRSSKTALHYIKLKQVVNPAGAAAKLGDLPLETGGVYKLLNNLRGSRQAFQ